MVLPDFVAKGGLDLQFPTGHQAELDLVAHRAANHRCSVTRATAAKPMPVDRHTTSRMRGTAAIPCTAAMSALRSVFMMGI